MTPDVTTVKVDSLQVFTAAVFDPDGAELIVPLEWSVTGDIGAIDESGVFTGDLAGQGTVIAKAFEVSASADVTVEIVLELIAITPEVLNAQKGDEVQYSVEVYDTRGNLVEESVVWSLEGEIGQINEDGMFTAENVGEGAVFATVNELSNTAGVTIIESLTIESILITPAEAVAFIGDDVDFSALVLDNDGNEADVQIDWSVKEEFGLITNEGVFTGSVAGTDSIFASVTLGDSTLTAFAQIAIHLELVSLPQIKENETVPIEGVAYPLDFLNGTKLFFPTNSVSDDIQIEIKLPSTAQVDDTSREVVFAGEIFTAIKLDVIVGDEVVSPYYFDEPIEISIPYNAERLNAMGLDPLELGMFFVTSNGDLNEHGITDIRVDTVAQLIIGKVAHFSELALAEIPEPVMLGDFDDNKILDFVDYTTMVAAMNRGSALCDICGPATPIPGLVYEPPWTTLNYPYPADSSIDFEDLMGFTLMYNWYNSDQGTFSARTFAAAKKADYVTESQGLITDSSVSQVGEQFTTMFSAGSLFAFLGAEIKLSYSSNILKVVSVSNTLSSISPGVSAPVHYGYNAEPGILRAATVALGATANGIDLYDEALFIVEFEVIGSGPYHIALEDISVRDSRNQSQALEVSTKELRGSIEHTDTITAEPFGLMQNTPNPFNIGTTIPYIVSSEGDVTLRIYNSLGQEVRSLLHESVAPGMGSVFWNGMDDYGEVVTSGVYIVTIQQGKQTDTLRILLLK